MNQTNPFFSGARADLMVAFGTVFAKEHYRLLAIGAAFAAAFAFIWVPVATTPGNDFAFYFRITPWWNYVFLLLFAAGFGFMLPMQVYLLRQKAPPAKEKAKGLAPVVSSALAGIYATAACAGCVTTVFSFFGFGGVLFLLEYRLPLLAVSLALLAASVYYTARQIAGHCPECAVVSPNRQV
jgi:hypothetical protein